MRPAGRLIRVVEPAFRGFRAYPGTSILLIGVVAVLIAAALPVTSLLLSGSWHDTRLILSTMRDPIVPAQWAPPARPPAATRAAAIGGLFTILLGAGGAVVAVAAITLAALFGARESRRASEMAVRRAVGASRRLLLASALLEACAVALVGLTLGGVAGWFVSQRAAQAWPGSLAGGWVMPSVIAAGVVAVLLGLCSMLPRIFARDRLAMVAPAGAVPRLLPAFQLGSSLIVLTAAGLLGQAVTARLDAARSLPTGGEVFRQVADESRPAERAERYAALLDTLDAGKRFDSVSLTAIGGVVGLGTVSAVTTDCGQCTEGGIFLPWHVVAATHQFVSADTFRALGTRLLAGRGITPGDRWGSLPVAVVNRSLALRHFQRGEAVGRQILLGNDARIWHTVVGIVDDAPVRGLGGSLQPPFTVYASVLQHPVAGVDLLIRPRGSTPIDFTAVAAVRHAFTLGGSNRSRATETELVSAELLPLQWFADWIGFEGWAVMVLACGGTFALVRLWVLSLLSELGVRRAVGARRRHVVALVLFQAAGIGLGGLAAALWFGPGLWNVLHGVMAGLPAWDGAIVGRYATILLSAVVLGAFPPAWQAARTPPGRLLTWS